MSDAALPGSGGADSSILIECSPVAIEEIRRQAAAGVAQSARGRLEVGGVLYGTREGSNLRIETVRPIESGHAGGPSFSLSDADRAKLKAQIAQAATDPRLEKYVCLGWFITHSHPEMALAEADVEVFSTCFPEPWQVTLVVNPQRGAMKGGFFVREPDGTIQANKIFKQFNFPDRLAGVLQTAPPSRSETRPASRAPQQFPAPERIERARSPLSIEGAGYYPDPVSPRKIWPWIVGGVAVVIALVVLGLQFWQGSEPESLRLVVTERDGQLQIEWNSTMRAVTRATGGSLNILDGSSVERISLSRTQLGEGRYMYTRKNGDVEVRMEVDSDGDTVRESSRFLGRAPLAGVPEGATRVDEGRTESLNTNAASSDPEKAALVEENKRIRLENAVLKERVQQLERIQKILETRLGVTGKE